MVALFLCLGALFIAGCQPQDEVEVDLQGQVFVVVPSGESVRLGSVQVMLYEERAIQAHLAKRERVIAQRQEELESAVAELGESLKAARASRREAEENYMKREARIREELAALVERAEAKAAGIARKMVINEEFITHVDVLPSAPPGIPTREEYAQYESRRAKWLAMDRAERQAWGEVLSSHNEELEAELEKMATDREEQVFAWADELQLLDEAIGAAREEEAEAEGSLRVAEESLAAIPSYSDFLAELPAPAREIRTDADGEFSIALPAGGRYAILARSERRMQGEERAFQWFIWTTAGETYPRRVLLSNHNVVSAGAAENVVRLSDPEQAQASS